MRFLLLMVSRFLPLYVGESHYTKIYAYQYCLASLAQNGILFNIVYPDEIEERDESEDMVMPMKVFALNLIFHIFLQTNFIVD